MIDAAIPKHPALFLTAGEKGSQTADLVHATTLVVERSIDQMGQGGFAQLDVAAYFDSVSLTLLRSLYCIAYRWCRQKFVAALLIWIPGHKDYRQGVQVLACSSGYLPPMCLKNCCPA